MPTTSPASYEDLPLADLEQVDAVCDVLIAAWRRGERPRLETLVQSSPPSVRLQLASKLIRTELELRRSAGEFVPLSEMIDRFPQWARELQLLLSDVNDQVVAGFAYTSADHAAEGRAINNHLATPQTGSAPSAGVLLDNSVVLPWPPRKLGNYELGEVLSVSSLGITSLARDIKLNRDVVIKIQSPTAARNAGAKEQFLRAARAAADLSHENIVAVYAVKEINGLPFLAMEYVDGTSLSECLRLPAPLPVDDIVSIGRQVAAALQVAHQRGIIHGCINPQNILLEENANDSRSFRVRIINFGMSRLAAEAEAQLSTTASAALSFLSPEQALNLPIDSRADLFSLGALLYALCTRRDPFVGDSPTDVRQQVVNFEPPSIHESNPATPAWLVRVIERLMLKRRDDRFQTAGEVLVALKNSGGTAESPTSSQARWRRGGWLAVAAAGLLMAMLTAERPDSSVPTKEIISLSAANNNPAENSREQAEQRVSSAAPLLSTAIAPFNTQQARAYQTSWASRLGVPREWTNSIGMRFVLIPPGEYTRGVPVEANTLYRGYFPSDTHMLECFDTQSPPHRVVIAKSFYLGVCEVTQGQYSTIVERNPATFSAQGRLSQAVEGQDTSGLPIETVSWNDAVLFCRRLSEGEGHSLCYTASDELQPDGSGYRLPSDAEWEYACRAGTETRHSNGDSDQELREVGWTSSQAGNEAGADAPPHPVGQLKTNAFGLNDMHGNLWEWCHDWYSTSYYREFIQPRMVDPFGPAASPTRERTIRGGYYHGPPYRGHSANRDCCRTDLGFHHIGFRVLMSVEGVQAIIQRTGSQLP